MAVCNGQAAEDAKSSEIENKVQSVVAMVKVYPNPTTGRLFLEFNENYEDLHLEVYDMNGRTVHEFESFSGESIDVSSLNQGLYVLRIISGEHSSSIRFLLTK